MAGEEPQSYEINACADAEFGIAVAVPNTFWKPAILVVNWRVRRGSMAVFPDGSGKKRCAEKSVDVAAAIDHRPLVAFSTDRAGLMNKGNIDEVERKGFAQFGRFDLTRIEKAHLSRLKIHLDAIVLETVQAENAKDAGRKIR